MKILQAIIEFLAGLFAHKVTTISRDGIAMIKHWEGLSLSAYPDPATGGDPWTIGYGDTVNVRPGMIITEAEAEKRLQSRLDIEFVPGVLTALDDVKIRQREFDSCVSLAYNVGVDAFSRSTLVRKLKEGDRMGAADEFPRWHNAAGKSMRGLRRRRACERAYFLGESLENAIKIGEATP